MPEGRGRQDNAEPKEIAETLAGKAAECAALFRPLAVFNSRNRVAISGSLTARHPHHRDWRRDKLLTFWLYRVPYSDLCDAGVKSSGEKKDNETGCRCSVGLKNRCVAACPASSEWSSASRCISEISRDPRHQRLQDHQRRPPRTVADWHPRRLPPARRRGGHLRNRNSDRSGLIAQDGHSSGKAARRRPRYKVGPVNLKNPKIGSPRHLSIR
jgi:hypothetical protein